MIRCTNCSNLFDCLELLCDQPELEADIETPSETINWNQDAKQNSSPHWIAGFVLGLALLAFQTYNLKSTFFTQHHLFRPWLINTCSLLNCQLPIYKNPAELEVLHSSFEPLDPLSYRFQIAISNEAPFSQPYPKIKLVLVDFLGNSFAERIFYPNEYYDLKLVIYNQIRFIIAVHIFKDENRVFRETEVIIDENLAQIVIKLLDRRFSIG